MVIELGELREIGQLLKQRGVLAQNFLGKLQIKVNQFLNWN